MNIDSVIEQKIESYSKHVSRFPPSINKYRPDWDPRDLERFRKYWRERHPRKDGRYVEAFRRTTGFNPK